MPTYPHEAKVHHSLVNLPQFTYLLTYLGAT